MTDDVLAGLHPSRGALHHPECRVPDLDRAVAQWGWLLSHLGYHGWTLMFPNQHPHAGGRDHYAAYLINTDGYEVELVATTA